MRHRLIAVTFAMLVLAAPASRALDQEPALQEVLARAGRSVTELQRQLSGVVAEESYVQDISDMPAFGARSSARPAVTHRVLKSDLLLVKPEGTDRWIQFRDVFDVDGTPVRDRSDRLMKLFVNPTASTAAQVDQIVRESVRYNIGNVLRNFNVPLFALLILEPKRQPHFKFTPAEPGPAALARDLGVPPGALVVRYQESDHQTMIRTTNDRDLPMHGRFWIDPATGHVLMSELIAEDFAISGTIVVKYEAGVLPGVLVPTVMRERYVERRNNMRVNGAATYGRFRQFQVKVDEKIAPIK